MVHKSFDDIDIRSEAIEEKDFIPKFLDLCQ